MSNREQLDKEVREQTSLNNVNELRQHIRKHLYECRRFLLALPLRGDHNSTRIAQLLAILDVFEDMAMIITNPDEESTNAPEQERVDQS